MGGESSVSLFLEDSASNKVGDITDVPSNWEILWSKFFRKMVICWNSGRSSGFSAQQDCMRGTISVGTFSMLGLRF